MKSDIEMLADKGTAAKAASHRLAYLSTDIKNKALLTIADDLLAKKEEILTANRTDYQEGEAAGLNVALLDRLMLDNSRLEAISSDVRAVAALADPVGETFETHTLANGLQVSKRRVPLGVIGAIYESRPNVTVDISALCLKSGNAVILRGGKETINSNLAIINVIQGACKKAGPWGLSRPQTYAPEPSVTL